MQMALQKSLLDCNGEKQLESWSVWEKWPNKREAADSIVVQVHLCGGERAGVGAEHVQLQSVDQV